MPLLPPPPIPFDKMSLVGGGGSRKEGGGVAYWPDSLVDCDGMSCFGGGGGGVQGGREKVGHIHL